MAYWEAYTLIKTPAYRCGSGTYTSRAIYPPIVREVGGDIPLSELLYKKYKLFVFNLSYNKVLYGRFFFLKHLTIYQVVRLICMYIIGVNRLTLFIITTMLKLIRGKTYDQVLFELFIHPEDSRILLSIDNRWVANGPHEFLKRMLNSATNINGDKIKFSNNCLIELQEIFNKIKQIDNTKMYMAKFTEVGGSKTPHEIYPEISTRGKLALQTDLIRSIENHNYNKPVLVNNYQGWKKPSRMLEHNYDDLEQKTKEVMVSVKGIARGALCNGYNNDLVSVQFSKVVSDLDGVYKMIDTVIERNSWNVDKNQLFNIIDGLDTVPTPNTDRD